MVGLTTTADLFRPVKSPWQVCRYEMRHPDSLLDCITNQKTSISNLNIQLFVFFTNITHNNIIYAKKLWRTLLMKKLNFDNDKDQEEADDLSGRTKNLYRTGWPWGRIIVQTFLKRSTKYSTETSKRQFVWDKVKSRPPNWSAL